MASKKGPTIASNVIPQFDNTDRIVEAVTVLSQGPLTDETIDLSHRHVNYVKQAARVLGLLSSDNELTAIGRRAIGLTSEPRRRLLQQQFEKSTCGSAWLAWARASTLDELDADSGGEFLAACTDLPPGMVERRSRTLRRWCNDLRSKRDEDPTASKHPGKRRR